MLTSRRFQESEFLRKKEVPTFDSQLLTFSRTSGRCCRSSWRRLEVVNRKWEPLFFAKTRRWSRTLTKVAEAPIGLSAICMVIGTGPRRLSQPVHLQLCLMSPKFYGVSLGPRPAGRSQIGLPSSQSSPLRHPAACPRGAPLRRSTAET